MKYLSLLFFISLLPCSLWASGRTVGNGGDVVICEDSNNNIQSIELLDFYEGRVLKGIITELGEAQWSIEKKIAYALARLDRVSPARAKRYAEHAAVFFAEALFLDGAELEDIKDSGNIVIPKGCRIAQIANQSEPLYPDDKRYIIDRRLWDALDHNSQAGLILHEVIYREALEWEHEDSVSVRLLNSNLCSKKIDSMSVQQYSKFLLDLGFGSNEIQGAQISLLPVAPEFYPNGNLKKARVVFGSAFKWQDQNLSLRNEISFYDSGILKELALSQVHELNIFGEIRKISPYELRFFPSGKVESATFEGVSRFRTEFYDLRISGSAYFHENGLIRLANVQQGEIQILGQKTKLLQVTQIDEKGQFREGSLVDPIFLMINGFKIRASEHLKLDAFQKVSVLSLVENSTLAVGESSARFRPWFKIFFHEGSEQIRKACLATDTRLKNSAGKLTLYPAQSVLTLTPAGLVEASENGC